MVGKTLAAPLWRAARRQQLSGCMQGFEAGVGLRFHKTWQSMVVVVLVKQSPPCSGVQVVDSGRLNCNWCRQGFEARPDLRLSKQWHGTVVEVLVR